MAGTFGKYQLLERLGGGGMAEVWRAEAEYGSGVKKTVALKMIRPELCSIPQFLSLFIDEARITSRISHANVAQVLDFGENDGRTFLVSELVEGTDLEKVRRKAADDSWDVPMDVASFIVAEVARGLAFAHTLNDPQGMPYGIVHRDVSPHNVLLSYAGEVKLTDFGIARAADKITQTETGAVMGKFRYMSPEQIGGKRLDSRSDVFACGILLHELLTGRQLFDAKSSGEVVDQVRYSTIAPPSATRDTIPEALDKVTMWALTRPLSERCPDAATLARELERYIHEAHPTFTREEVARLVERTVPRARPTSGANKPLQLAGTVLAPVRGTGSPPAGIAARLAGGDGTPKPGGQQAMTAPGKRSPSDATLEPNPTETSNPGPAADDSAIQRERESLREAVATLVESGDDADEYAETDAMTPAGAAAAAAARSARSTSTPPEPAAVEPPRASTGPERPAEPERTAPTKPVSSPSVRAASAAKRPTLDETRTSPRTDPPGRRTATRPKRRFRWEPLLGVLLALLIAGVVALLLLRGGPSQPAAPPPPDDTPRATTAGDAAAGATKRDDARAARATDAETPADGAAPRLVLLREQIAKLEPAKHLGPDAEPERRRRLLERLAHRVGLAVRDAQGEPTLGPERPGPPLPDSPAVQLADRYAELLLIADKVPALLARAAKSLRPKRRANPRRVQPPPRPFPAREVVAALAAPRDAGALRRYIIAQTRAGGWRTDAPPGEDRRWAFPHLVERKAALAKLLELSGNKRIDQDLQRYLAAHERGRSGRAGKLSYRVAQVEWVATRKSELLSLMISVAVQNTDPAQAAPCRPAAFSLLGAGVGPVAPYVSDPEISLPAGTKRVTKVAYGVSPKLRREGHLVLSIPAAGEPLHFRVASTALDPATTTKPKPTPRPQPLTPTMAPPPPPR